MAASNLSIEISEGRVQLFENLTMGVGRLNLKKTLKRRLASAYVDQWLEALKRHLLPIESQSFSFNSALKDGRILAVRNDEDWERTVVELYPAVRPIQINLSSRLKLYHLAFPYVYVCINRYLKGEEHVDVGALYRNSPAQSLKDQLYRSNLPNNLGNFFCLGTAKAFLRSLGNLNELNLNERVEKICDVFWNSDFGRDETADWDNAKMRIPSHPGSFAEWEEKTKKDPSFVLGLEWLPSEHTIESWMRVR